MDNNTLLQRAKKVLLNNLYEVKLNGKLYRRTVPSKEFYVHQWNWDSATHAMGLVYIDEQRAYDELKSLISGQWDNGLIAQITFNPNETKYFPGPEFWGTEKYANGDIITSGITQPPLLGISFAHVYKNTKSEDLKTKLVKEILPGVVRYHEYLKNYRDPENSGLLTVVHPWESGTDNSPRWDRPLAAIKLSDIPDEVKIMVNKYRSDAKLGDSKHRPGMDDYYRYMYLVKLFNDWKWDYKQIIKNTPFAVKDILFNALWCRSNQALVEVLKDVSDSGNAVKLEKWADETKKAISKTWDEKLSIYKDIDINLRENFIEENTIATFVPLWATTAGGKQLELLLDKLNDKEQFWPDAPVPTTALNSKKFSLTKYWRGPTWPITNLFVIEGLNMYKENKRALKLRDELARRTIDMVKKNGFYEYFDPTSGVARPDKKGTSALGFGAFSWTAAISLYLLHKYRL